MGSQGPIHDKNGSSEDVEVGLLTVFEHHEAMTTTLCAFLREYRTRRPVGVRVSADGGEQVLQTMAAKQRQAAPTLPLIDPTRPLRQWVFGRVAELPLGAGIMPLLLEPVQNTPGPTA